MPSMGQPIDRLHRDGPIEGKADQSEQMFRDGRAGNHPRRGTDYRQRGKHGQEPKNQSGMVPAASSDLRRRPTA